MMLMLQRKPHEEETGKRLTLFLGSSVQSTEQQMENVYFLWA